MKIYEVYFDDLILDEFFLDDAIKRMYEEDALMVIDRKEKILYTFEETYEKCKDEWLFVEEFKIIFLPKDIPYESET